jgi:hypothetical protein
VPVANKVGTEQHIDFAPVPDQKLGTKSIRLHASSSANVPVSFYVREGPAILEGDRVIFAAIPVRARMPIAVTVVAWQYGRASDPKLQSAVPVTRTFYLVR